MFCFLKAKERGKDVAVTSREGCSWEDVLLLLGWVVWRKTLEILQEAWSTTGILKRTGSEQGRKNY